MNNDNSILMLALRGPKIHPKILEDVMFVSA